MGTNNSVLTRIFLLLSCPFLMYVISQHLCPVKIVAIFKPVCVRVSVFFFLLLYTYIFTILYFLLLCILFFYFILFFKRFSIAASITRSKPAWCSTDLLSLSCLYLIDFRECNNINIS